MQDNNGTVNIRGKEYKTVALRVSEFRSDHPDWTIESDVIHRDEQTVVIKATIRDTDGRVLATGHAEENRRSSQINKTSALENCETSAWGRALAALGYAGSEMASADEVANAISQQQAGNTSAPSRPASGGAVRGADYPMCPACGNKMYPSKFDNCDWYCNKKYSGCGKQYMDHELGLQAEAGPPDDKGQITYVNRLRQYLHKTVGCSDVYQADAVVWLVTGGAAAGYDTVAEAVSTEEAASATLNAISDHLADAGYGPAELLRKAVDEKDMDLRL